MVHHSEIARQQAKEVDRTINLFNLQRICEHCDVNLPGLRVSEAMLSEALKDKISFAIARLGDKKSADRATLVTWIHAFSMYLKFEHPDLDHCLWEAPLEILSSALRNLDEGHVDSLCQASLKGGRPGSPIAHRTFRTKCVVASDLFYEAARANCEFCGSTRSVIDKKVARLAFNTGKQLRVSVSGPGIAEWRKKFRAVIGKGDAGEKVVYLANKMHFIQLLRTCEDVEKAFKEFIAETRT